MNLITPDEIDQILNIRIIRLASKLSLIFQRETLRPRGIQVQQWRLLVSLSLNGELHLRSLARDASQDPAHTSRVVKSMIGKGWINSRPDEEDQRRIQYKLTDNGAAIVQDVWPHAKALANDMAGLFGESEFEQFKGMLDKASVSCDARLKRRN